MQENERIEEVENDEEFAALGDLKSAAPEASFERLHKRVQIAQLGKDLVEKQAMGFWAVIDAFLRMIFLPAKKPGESDEKTETGEK